MSGAAFLIIIVAFGFLYFVLMRPQKRRQVESQRMLQSRLEVGDEIVTAGGIFGTITALGDDEVRVEIAPQLEVRVARRAVGGVIAREDERDDGEPDAAEPTASEDDG
jgi:preprotein translocase subunit YajC